MKKQTKLTEKSTRIPDTRQVQWQEVIPKYLSEVEQLNKEQARSHRFAMLLQQLLSIEPNFIENYSSGIEKSLKVRQKDRILKGEADNLFGNVIIEFEVNIPENALKQNIPQFSTKNPAHLRLAELGKDCTAKVERWLAGSFGVQRLCRWKHPLTQSVDSKKVSGLQEGEGWLARGEAGNIKSIGKLRSMVRELLKDELGEIDGLVKGILG